MIVETRFFSSNIAGKLRDGAYELPEGSTVTRLMDAAFDEAMLDFPADQRINFVFVYDNSPASPETVLSDGGKLRVLFKITGG